MQTTALTHERLLQKINVICQRAVPHAGVEAGLEGSEVLKEEQGAGLKAALFFHPVPTIEGLA